MLLPSLRSDFFTLLTTLCGISFIGEPDGEGETRLSVMDTEGVIVDSPLSMVDDSDEVVDAAEQDDCEL